jgi:hypothetical protein
MKYAVALIDYETNNLHLRIAQAGNELLAIAAAFPGYAHQIAHATDLTQASAIAREQDWDFEVVEIR